MCNGEAPDVAQLARRHGEDVTFVGVAGLDEVSNMRAFVERHGLEFSQLADPDGSLSATHFEIRGHSSWIFIDGDTGALRRHVGPLSAEELEAFVTDLLDG